MNILPGKRFWKTAVVLLTTAVCLTVSARQPIAPVRQNADILEYQFISAEAFKQAFDHLKNIAEKSIWDTRLTEKQIRFSLTWYTACRLIFDLSGLEHTQSFTRVSYRTSGGMIRQEEFLKLDPAAPGLVNRFPADKNQIDTKGFLSSIPDGATVTVIADIRPQALLEALEQCGAFREKLLAIIPEQFPLQEMVSQSTGLWAVVLVDESNFCISLPDKKEMVFRFMALLGGRKDLTSLGDRLNIGKMIVEKKDGRLNFYSNAAMEKLFHQTPTRRIDPELVRQLPEKAFCAAYISGNAGKLLNGDLRINNINIKIPDSPTPSISVVCREKDGIRTISCGSSTLLADDMELLLEFITALPDLKLPEDKEEIREKPAVRPVADPTPAKKCRCDALLNNRIIISAGNSKIKAGFYKLTPAGLLRGDPKNYDLVFFGRIGSKQPYPQFITVPHKESFCVRFSDGRIINYHLSNPRSFRRIIGFLMTHKKFSEELFIQLIKTANILDSQSLPAK